jgi:hypothetical protein
MMRPKILLKMTAYDDIAKTPGSVWTGVLFFYWGIYRIIHIFSVGLRLIGMQLKVTHL